MRKLTTHICLGLLVSLSCQAQNQEFYLGFDQILDNREYFTDYARHQTIFGARINPGVSLSFDSVHRINAGVNYMYEFGGSLLGVIPQIDLYYSYISENLQAHFGSFPRRDVLDYPLLLLTDSLDYYRPNMEGTSICYTWEWGTIHGWIDWTGRAAEDTRESILAGIDATFRAGMYYVTPIATRYHLARTEAADDNNRLRDDGSLMLLTGVDLSDRTQLDQFNVSTGLAATYVWARPANYQWFGGWLSQLKMIYRIFGFKGTYYRGGASPLLYGDRLYSSGNYGRVDLFVDPFKNPRISSKIAFNFHILPGDGLYFSQQILIHINLY